MTKRMIVLTLTVLAALSVMTASAFADTRPVWPITTTMSSYQQ
jgi:hypothetical protein